MTMHQRYVWRHFAELAFRREIGLYWRWQWQSPSSPNELLICNHE